MELLFIIVIIVFIVIKFFKRNTTIKGKVGEEIVRLSLEDIPGYNKIINNIYINDNGKSRQIDHILINQYGIFVIETKNFNGTIYGKEESDQWYQYLGGKKYPFKNPILQNYAHKRIIEDISEHKEEIHSVVVFTSKCKLKIICKNTPVIYNYMLINYVIKQGMKLNTEKIDFYYNQIMENRITDKDTIKEHKSNVRHYVEYKKGIANNGVCPRCYSKLIIKNGKYGKFLSCSNYPECKYRKSLS